MTSCCHSGTRAKLADPESITTGVTALAQAARHRAFRGYGFRLSRFALGRNDGEGEVIE